MTSPAPAPVSTSRWSRLVDQLLDVLLGNVVERSTLIALVIATAVILALVYLSHTTLLWIGPVSDTSVSR